MLVYRIAKWKFIGDLTGTGARLFGGRWNREGLPVLYTSTHLSLAVLELLANNVRQLIDKEYGYIILEVPGDQISFLPIDKLSEGWRMHPYTEETIVTGTEWLQGQSSLALGVPSAVLKQEQNVLINPVHPEFSEVRIVGKELLDLDGRVTR